jgi:peptide/nickel transport system substrate-binding protein
MIRTDRAASRAAILLVALAAAIPGCDCTAPRGKPWRHDPDPESLAAAEPRSPALVRETITSEVLANRDHTLRVQMDAEPRALNPLISPNVWARRITMGTVFETLIRYEPPEEGAGSGSGRYSPGLATSWQIMDGGRVIKFNLERGVTFHDGRRMTAVDVQFTLDAIRTPSEEIDHLRPWLADIGAVEIWGPHEIRIEMYQPNAWVLRALAEIPILPYHVYERGFSAGGKIIGTGPWQLQSWKDRTVHLTRYGGYWGKAPAIPDLQFVFEPDAARALSEAKRGGYDIIPALIPSHWPEQAQAAGFLPLELKPPRFKYLAFQCTQPPLDDARVRQAIALLIDRQTLARDAYDGLARPVAGPVWKGGPGDGPGPAAPEHDPDAAGRLLEEAGWIDSDKDGVRDRGGQQLHIDILTLVKDRPASGQADPERKALVENLRRYGIAANLKPGESDYVMKLVRAGSFGIAFLEFAQPVDTDLTSLLSSEGRHNWGRCASKRIDAALEEMRGAWDPADRARPIAEIAAALAEEWPIAGVVAAAPQGLVHERIAGVVVWDGWIDMRRLAFQ